MTKKISLDLPEKAYEELLFWDNYTIGMSTK